MFVRIQYKELKGCCRGPRIAVRVVLGIQYKELKVIFYLDLVLVVISMVNPIQRIKGIKSIVEFCLRTW